MYDTTRSLAQAPAAVVRDQVKAAAVPAKARLAYIDNLRLVMILFVIIMHTAVTYSGMGSWYYTEKAAVDPVSMLLFGLYQAFTQAYFMGLLFLVAGFFVPAAYDRKGFGPFIKERLVRLGIPTLIYMLVIHPFMIYALLGDTGPGPKPGVWTYYSGYITRLDFIGSSGPLWFALALLIFSLVYALVRRASRRPMARPAAETRLTTPRAAALILLIGLCAFLIRLVQPMGTSILNMQLCYFAAYIILFIVGIRAYRSHWFEHMDTAFGLRWLRAGLIAGPLLFIALMFGGGVMSGGLDAFNGGWHWQSLAYALWEAFVAVSMSIGLLTLFREKYNSQNRLVKILSDNSFAAYVFHAPVLTTISLLLVPLALLPLAKFVLVSLLAILTTFSLTFLVLRRIPLLKRVI